MFLVAVIGYFAYNTNGKPKCKTDITHKPLLGILLLSSFNFFLNTLHSLKEYQYLNYTRHLKQ